jgi:hypothetical protein
MEKFKSGPERFIFFNYTYMLKTITKAGATLRYCSSSGCIKIMWLQFCDASLNTQIRRRNYCISYQPEPEKAGTETEQDPH